MVSVRFPQGLKSSSPLETTCQTLAEVTSYDFDHPDVEKVSKLGLAVSFPVVILTLLSAQIKGKIALFVWLTVCVGSGINFIIFLTSKRSYSLPKSASAKEKMQEIAHQLAQISSDASPKANARRIALQEELEKQTTEVSLPYPSLYSAIFALLLNPAPLLCSRNVLVFVCVSAITYSLEIYMGSILGAAKAIANVPYLELEAIMTRLVDKYDNSTQTDGGKIGGSPLLLASTPSTVVPQTAPSYMDPSTNPQFNNTSYMTSMTSMQPSTMFSPQPSIQPQHTQAGMQCPGSAFGSSVMSSMSSTVLDSTCPNIPDGTYMSGPSGMSGYAYGAVANDDYGVEDDGLRKYEEQYDYISVKRARPNTKTDILNVGKGNMTIINSKPRETTMESHNQPRQQSRGYYISQEAAEMVKDIPTKPTEQASSGRVVRKSSRYTDPFKSNQKKT